MAEGPKASWGPCVLYGGPGATWPKLVASCGIATAAFLGIRSLVRWGWRKYRESKFEFASLDLVSLTKELAKAQHAGGKGSCLGRVPKGRWGVKSLFKKAPQVYDSLIPDVLQDLEETAGQTALDALAPAEEVDCRSEALAAVGAPPFRRFLRDKGLDGQLTRKPCEVLQLNIGLYCNQACTHCHVESSPLRKEMATEDVVDRLLHLIRASPSVTCLDITGGAPEMNFGFRKLVQGAAAIRDAQDGGRPSLRILDRCNLTVLMEPGQEDLAQFLADNRVDVVASLPSYDPGQTDKQRGRKVFQRSIEGLRMLNSLGYGAADASTSDEGLRLHLVFNPPGPFLPPKQEQLSVKYHDLLKKEHGVVFNELFTLANMPVKRFFDFLRKQGTLEGYMDLLVRNFNPDTVPVLMCLNTVNVRYDGRIYDCDFNQQLELEVGGKKGLTIFDINTLDDDKLQKASIRTGAHCYGCTATQGSG